MNSICNYCKHSYVSTVTECVECYKLDLCISNNLFEPIDKPMGECNEVDYVFEEKEMVNHPSHYTQGIEAIDYIESHKMNFCIGNVIKYITRAKHKGTELQDLKKASWYLNREIERLEKGE